MANSDQQMAKPEQGVVVCEVRRVADWKKTGGGSEQASSGKVAKAGEGRIATKDVWRDVS